MPEIHVPIGFNVNDTARSLHALQRRLGLVQVNGDVHLDLTDCAFLGPMAVAALALAHDAWLREGRSVRVSGPTHRTLAAYCVFSGLALRLGFGSAPDVGHPLNVTTALRMVTTRDNTAILEVGRLVARFVEMTDDTEEVLRVLIAELVQNVADHAASPGAVSARVYTNQRDVRVCVADHGLGLRATLAGPYGVDLVGDDQAALRMALEKGRSSRSRPHNAGQGLNLLDDLLRVNGGELLLASGSACYSRRGQSRISVLPVPFPGTLCVMRFRIDNALYGPADRVDDIW